MLQPGALYPKTKNVLFLVRSNNDLDHYLPLIVDLKRAGRIDPIPLVFYDKHTVLKNELFVYICGSNNVSVESLIDIFNFKRISKIFSRLYEHTFVTKEKSDTINGTCKNSSSTKNFMGKIKKMMVQLLTVSKRYILFLLILPDKNIIKYLELNNIGLVIGDITYFEKSLVDSKVPSNAMYAFVKQIKEKNIPFMMIPHGPQTVYETPLDAGVRGMNANNIFRPDFLEICNEREFHVHRMIRGLKKTLISGDPRYDVPWMNYLESSSLKVYDSTIEKPRDKKVLLYLVANLTTFMDRYPIDSNYELEIHRDILSLVNHFPDLELWVKLHPRHPNNIPIDDLICEEWRGNIKQFGNDTDTNILIAKADMCITLYSISLITPILQKKPVIYYDKWKERITGATAYLDDYSFILKASNKVDLIAQCKKALNHEYNITDVDIDNIYKDVFSVKSISENMTRKYVEVIKQILDKKDVS